MKVTSIKNMVVDSREKSSPKVSRSVEMGPFVAPNDTQALVAHRPLPVRHEYSKRTQNKLIVRNSNKKVIAPMAPSKLDGRSFVPLLGIFGSSEAMDQVQISQTSGPNALGNCRRNLKQLYDMRTVPITSMPLNFGTDGGATPQTRKPGAAGAEEKRSSVRNRTEFFNSLRRKAAESGASQSNFVRSDSVLQEKTAEVRNKGELEASLKISGNYAHDDATELQDNRTRISAAQDSHRNTICSNNSHDTIIDPHMKDGKKVPPPVNGLIADEVGFVATRSSVDISVEVPDGPTCSEEEEEEAFLESLGWEDNAGEGEALTKEEINAFYQQHGKFLATSRSSLHKQRSKDSVMHSDIDSPIPGSMSSGLGSSETDSDDELQIQQ
ncbi:hypothetical protein O6H91_17G020800 [Diphasiastrum complanatum]|uniref:Uncharacterized protein n=2 Tax=Diphasiastrum complanatum TaxID=34168 RepID=A0ACC2B4S3_DIPCM|nr:hypothetical protein O6H91_17G012600 [Diphasiastrum complanatum]KAJ7524774.1 hypothetical protein O6H91_17G020800 [Diphasiastrum complanatum]